MYYTRGGCSYLNRRFCPFLRIDLNSLVKDYMFRLICQFLLGFSRVFGHGFVSVFDLLNIVFKNFLVGLRKKLRHVYRNLRKLTKTLRRYIEGKQKRRYYKRL